MTLVAGFPNPPIRAVGGCVGAYGDATLIGMVNDVTIPNDDSIRRPTSSLRTPLTPRYMAPS